MSSSTGALNRATQIFEFMIQTKCFNGVLSAFKVVDATPKSVKAEYVVSEEHTNPMGTLHGGFTSTAVDFMTTLALLTTDTTTPGVSLNLSVNYLKAMKSGEKVTFEAEVVRKGRSIAYTTANVFNEKGELAAHGTHIKHLGN